MLFFSLLILFSFSSACICYDVTLIWTGEAGHAEVLVLACKEREPDPWPSLLLLQDTGKQISASLPLSR